MEAADVKSLEAADYCSKNASLCRKASGPELLLEVLKTDPRRLLPGEPAGLCKGVRAAGALSAPGSCRMRGNNLSRCSSEPDWYRSQPKAFLQEAKELV